MDTTAAGNGTVPATIISMEATATLERARAGDQRAFAELTGPHRRELQVHCYRMLGSLTDAEDALQESLLAAWRGLAAFDGRASVRTWLYRIATNRCLNVRRDLRRRMPTEPTPPFTPPEPTDRDEIRWLQPYPDSLLEGLPDTAPGPDAQYDGVEAVGLAFVAALQRLPPRQAAALILKDVLGYGQDEVADLLDTTPTAVKGMLQRARGALAGLAAGGPSVHPDRDRSGASAHREPRDLDAVAERFARAYLDADIEGLIALLTDDVWLAMPPAPHRYHGTDAIRAFLAASFGYRGRSGVALRPTRANGASAFGSYLAPPGSGSALPSGLFVLDTSGGGIRMITRFHLDEIYPRFGLPPSVPGISVS